MKSRNLFGMVLIAVAVLVLGCAKGNQTYKAGAKAESTKDYDTALDNYNKALQAEPNNTEYKLRAARARFEASQWHVDQGRKLRDQANLELALAEFRKAAMIDPSSPVAMQEVQATVDLIGAKQNPNPPQSSSPMSMSGGAIADEPKLMSGPPQLAPMSRAPINMKATNDAKAVFDAIGKLAGLTVIFDVDFTSRRISVELSNVTLEQALNIVALQSKAFWRPVTSNIIFIVPDQAQKRKDYEEEIVKTFYLRNTVLPQELTEIVTVIRQLLDLRRLQQINAQNAIVIRDTPDRVMLAGKIIDDIDKAKPEVVVQVAIMQARRDRMRNLGIQPSTSASIAFSNPISTTTSSTTSTTSTASSAAATLKQLQPGQSPGIFSNGYSVTMPSAQANFLMTDSSTHIIDNPEIRVVDGQTAKLRVGDRVPVATGSFQAGVGVGTGTGGAGLVNPLVNTQFQYLDVGVNVDVTPRIHPDHEVSLKVNIVVSSVTGTSNIGGISQPIISQRSIEHDVRLKDGEVNVLGGLIERTDSDIVNGWPGLAKLPFFKYFFSGDTVDHQENEVLIVLIPHIVRLPAITAENLRSIASGTDTNAEVHLEDEVMAPPIPKAQAAPIAPIPAPAAAPAQTAGPQNAALRFDPATASIKPGETTTIGVIVQNAQDLYSIPMLLQFNPAVISVEDVRQGGFLSGGTQEIAIVERVDKERGQAIISATRMPNTPGVSGSGTLVGVVIKGIAPGNSQLSIVQVNAKDSQQRPIQMVTSEAAIRVQ